MTEPDITELLPALAALRGQEIGVSPWRLVDQQAIDQFSALTDDAGPIHNDPEEAARIAPFGGTIVARPVHPLDTDVNWSNPLA